VDVYVSSLRKKVDRGHLCETHSHRQGVGYRFGVMDPSDVDRPGQQDTRRRGFLSLKMTLWMIVISVVLHVTLALVVLVLPAHCDRAVLRPDRVQARADAMADAIGSPASTSPDEDLNGSRGRALRYAPLREVRGDAIHRLRSGHRVEHPAPPRRPSRSGSIGVSSARCGGPG